MPEIQGKVQYMKVGDDFLFAQIREDGTNELELVSIWYLTGYPQPPAYVRTIQNMQFTMLRDSLVNGLSVIVQWEGSTGKVQNVRLIAAP
jgi:hypothetical protein